MPSESEGETEIALEFTLDFRRMLRSLTKKYRSIRSDLQSILDQLARGEAPGDQVPGIGYEVFKVRAANSDLLRGKSGGYRVIYHRVSVERVVLVAVYSKTEQGDVSAEAIRAAILEHEESTPTSSVEVDAEGGVA